MLGSFIIISLVGLVALKDVEVNLEKYPGNLCFRDCKNTTSQICYFNFFLERYHVLGPACGSCGTNNSNLLDCYNEQCVTADGVMRGIMTVNRQIPGPSFHVCKDDRIVVDVFNLMGGTAASIHWHGFDQRKTPYSDGIPFITQCPIDYSTTFRYLFYAAEPGTYYYHSHVGHHKANGIFGGIVVREDPKYDSNSNLYDKDLKEHLIVVTDWMYQDGEWYDPGLRDGIPFAPTNYLINGKGIIQDQNGRAKINTPVEVFRITRGLRYRFRLANSGSHSCPVSLEIKDHKLNVIASDSSNIQPVTVDILYSNPGERYDFVVNGNQVGDTFLIRLRGQGDCRTLKLQQFAILSYKDSATKLIDIAFPKINFPQYDEDFGGSISINNPHLLDEAAIKDYDISDLSSYVSSLGISDVTPDYSFCLGFDNQVVNVSDVTGPNKYEHFMNGGRNKAVIRRGEINGITFKFPSFSPLTQPQLVDDSDFCDKDSLPHSCEGKIVCPCVHRLKVKLNSIVELIVFDESEIYNFISHPFHLHGYSFIVMSMGTNDVKQKMTCAKAQNSSRILLNQRKRKPLKDTISIPPSGYVILRFKADNPGWWFFHCHYEFHMVNGMALVFQVGESREMVKPPKGFPTCNHYKPKVYFEDN